MVNFFSFCIFSGINCFGNLIVFISLGSMSEVFSITFRMIVSKSSSPPTVLAAVALLHCPSTAGTEELGHLEMIGTIVHQLTRNLTEDQIKTAGFDAYFVDHTAGVYPTAASGFPWSAASMQVKGDLIADLTEDLAAEQKARVTYDNILRLSDDPDVNDVIKFLRAREIVHFQRFGEGLRLAKEKMDQKNVYYVNPSFDK